MSDARAKRLDYRPADAHILRRLGASLIVHWDALPDDLQDQLIDQALLMEDPDGAEATLQSFETFIRKARLRDVKASA